MSIDQSQRELATRTGFRFAVRPARDDDEAALAEFFTHVTPEDLRFRFLTGLDRVGHEQLAALIAVDHRQTENFLAFDGDTLIATAMLACDAALDRGEVAIAIRADYKGRGVGWELLGHVSRVAEAKGVRLLEAVESRDNHAAIALECEMGFTAAAFPGDMTLSLVSKRLGALPA
jgi:GNAT superfamily N-acetyltransferase